MKKVCIIADSLAAQRPNGINKESRWPQILKNILAPVNFVTYARSLSTTKSIPKKINKIESDLYIIQLGIVDCAPRLFSYWESRVLYRLPSFIRKIVIHLSKKYRVQSTSRSYVNLDKFKSNIENLINKVSEAPIIYIKIINPDKSMLKKNPEILSSITSYNRAISLLEQEHENFHTVEIPHTSVNVYTLDDGYHLSECGHRYLADTLLSMIVKIS